MGGIVLVVVLAVKINLNGDGMLDVKISRK